METTLLFLHRGSRNWIGHYEIYAHFHYLTHFHYLRYLGARGHKKQKQETRLLNNNIKLKTHNLKTKTNPGLKVVAQRTSPPTGKWHRKPQPQRMFSRQGHWWRAGVSLDISRSILCKPSHFSPSRQNFVLRSPKSFSDGRVSFIIQLRQKYSA